mmetsp:Transcript_24605/g.68474  ORF Transcript_24605/g.68474 Transcript_24605/m.68474 type:complete len:212 (+) Transcript_24605:144-779(+)
MGRGGGRGVDRDSGSACDAPTSGTHSRNRNFRDGHAPSLLPSVAYAWGCREWGSSAHTCFVLPPAEVAPLLETDAVYLTPIREWPPLLSRDSDGSKENRNRCRCDDSLRQWTRLDDSVRAISTAHPASKVSWKLLERGRKHLMQAIHDGLHREQAALPGPAETEELERRVSGKDCSNLSGRIARSIEAACERPCARAHDCLYRQTGVLHSL